MQKRDIKCASWYLGYVHGSAIRTGVENGTTYTAMRFEETKAANEYTEQRGRADTEKVRDTGRR